MTSVDPNKSFMSEDDSLASAMEIQERASAADIDTGTLAPNQKGTVKEPAKPTDLDHNVAVLRKLENYLL